MLIECVKELQGKVKGIHTCGRDKPAQFYSPRQLEEMADLFFEDDGGYKRRSVDTFIQWLREQ